MSQRNRPQTFGMYRTKSGKYPCGACGAVGTMTRAHVPAQCAGNRGPIRSTTAIVLANNDIKRFPAREGGMFVFGLCAACNSTAGRLYDPAYAELADLLRPHWITDWRLELPLTIGLPTGEVRPGAVARSTLIAMSSLTPKMFDDWPEFLGELLDPGAAPSLPNDGRLMMAYSRGMTGRAEGFAATVIGPGRDAFITSFASIFFAPLAWQLVDEDSADLLSRQGWVDVSEWVTIPVTEIRAVNSLVKRMAATNHPLHNPNMVNGYWCHMSSEDVSILVETFDVTGKTSGQNLHSVNRHLNSQVYLPLPEDGAITEEWVHAHVARG